MARKFFIHIHIPKCGGTTVQKFLSHNFGRALGNTTTLLNTPKLTAAEVASIIRKWPGLRCLTGQRLTLDLPFEDGEFDLTAFTWVRDPVDRFVSSYFYNRHQSYDYLPQTRSMSLEEFAGWCFEGDGPRELSNLQTRTLVGDSLDMAVIRKRVEGGRLRLFPLSGLERSFYTLRRDFPGVFSDCRLKSRNISPKDQLVPESLRKWLMPFFEKDFELLGLAARTPLEELPARGLWEALRRRWRC